MPVSDPTDTDALEAAFLATYDAIQGHDPAEIVAQYDAALAHRDAAPDRSGASIAEEVGRSPTTVRTWLRGEFTPRPVQARDHARERGWLDLAWDDRTLHLLALLTVWANVRGSIAPRVYAPVWVPRDGTEPELHELIWELDVSAHLDRDRKEDITKLQPTGERGVSTLGRLLVALGAAEGKQKAAPDHAVVPDWLHDAPLAVRVDALRVVVRQQADRTGDAEAPLALTCRRHGSPHGAFPDRFLTDVGELAATVTDGVEYVGDRLVFDARAALLCQSPLMRGQWLGEIEA